MISGLVIESLTFGQQLEILREHKRELEAQQSIEPKKANTPLTYAIQEAVKLENQILMLRGNRQNI